MDQSLAEHESTMLRLGWIPEPPEGFIGLVGPIWRSPDVVGHFRLLTAQKHQNRNGVVHGGMLMTLADRAMGYTARAGDMTLRVATIHFSCDFIAPVTVGESLDIICDPLRSKGRLRFVRAQLFSEEQIVGAASGIWKVL